MRSMARNELPLAGSLGSMEPTRSPGGRSATLPTKTEPSNALAGGRLDAAAAAPSAGAVASSFASNDIGLRLDHVLDGEGKSVARGAIAAALGLNPVRLAKYVTGAEVPSLARALALATLLGCAVEDLYPNATDAARETALTTRASRGWTVAPSRFPARLPRPGVGFTARWAALRGCVRAASEAPWVLGILVMLGCGLDEPIPLSLTDAAQLRGVPLRAIRTALDAIERVGFATRTDDRPDIARCSLSIDWNHIAPLSAGRRTRPRPGTRT